MPSKDFRIARSTVAGLSDDRLCWAIMHQFWPGVEFDERERLAEVTPGQRAIYSCIVFAREVDNGGLTQFFENTSGDLYEEVLAGLLLMGANDRAEALRKGASFFGDDEAIPDRDHRKARLKAASRDDKKAFFDPLSELLYGTEDELLPLFRRYIDENPNEFFHDAAGS